MRGQLIAALALCAACSDGTGGQAISREYANTGRVCACAEDNFPFCDGEQQRFEANQPVFIQFHVTDVCLSSSCTRDREASCTITPNTTGLAVTTAAAYTDVAPLGGGCTADCGFLSATCATDALPAGDYTITYGTQSIALTIPSVVTAPCADN